LPEFAASLPVGRRAGARLQALNACMKRLTAFVGLAIAFATPAHGTEGGLVLRAEGRPAVAAPLLSTDVTIRVAGPVARARDPRG
jgi:hypothetical protein